MTETGQRLLFYLGHRHMVFAIHILNFMIVASYYLRTTPKKGYFVFIHTTQSNLNYPKLLKVYPNDLKLQSCIGTKWVQLIYVNSNIQN